MESRLTNLPKSAKEGADAACVSMEDLFERARHKTPQPMLVSQSLLEICRAMVANIELDQVLKTIIELTVQEMRAEQGSILLFDEHKDRLQMLAAYGLPEEIIKKGYIQRKGSIAEWVIEHAEPLILNDDAKGEEFQALDGRRRILTALCVPLKARGDVIGTININRTDPKLGPFEKRDVDVMDILASQAAICIENSRLHESCLQSARLAAIGQTVAGISHCMKNLLTGMKGGLSLCTLARQNQDWDIQEQATEILTNSINRVSALALDMLDYSKTREPERETVDLEALTTEIKGVTRSKAAAQGSEVLVHLNDDATTVEADGHQLFRCLLNLVENGLDANGSGGVVTITVERSEAEAALRRLSVEAPTAIVIKVKDEGKGIDAEHATQIFDPFFSTKGSKGTGLGLAVTHKILEEHGGMLELASKPGEPACFAIYLPA